MKVQACASCGARYNVERLARGARFECRRCGAPVEVGTPEMPSCRFAPGLLAAGTAMLATLFLFAHPAGDADGGGWPWEILQRPGDPAMQATVVLFALAGVWALVTALGVVPRSRSVPLLAVAAVLLAVCCAPEADSALAVDVSLRPLPLLLAMAALAAGLVMLKRPGAEGMARALAFGGGIALVWYYAFSFSSTTSTLQTLFAQVRDWVGGDLAEDVDVWGAMWPQWGVVLAGLVGVLVGFGAGGRIAAWLGMALLLVSLLLPAASVLFQEGFSGIDGTRLAQTGRTALAGSGLALWLLASYGLADLACNRKASA